MNSWLNAEQRPKLSQNALFLVHHIIPRDKEHHLSVPTIWNSRWMVHLQFALVSSVSTTPSPDVSSSETSGGILPHTSAICLLLVVAGVLWTCANPFISFAVMWHFPHVLPLCLFPLIMKYGEVGMLQV